MKLSKAQQKALDQMKTGVDYHADDLQCSPVILQELCKKELIGITYRNTDGFDSMWDVKYFSKSDK